VQPNDSRNLPGDCDPNRRWQGILAAPSCRRERSDSRVSVNAGLCGHLIHALVYTQNYTLRLISFSTLHLQPRLLPSSFRKMHTLQPANTSSFSPLHAHYLGINVRSRWLPQASQRVRVLLGTCFLFPTSRFSKRMMFGDLSFQYAKHDALMVKFSFGTRKPYANPILLLPIIFLLDCVFNVQIYCDKYFITLETCRSFRMFSINSHFTSCNIRSCGGLLKSSGSLPSLASPFPSIAAK
jgi:hypothetical protein